MKGRETGRRMNRYRLAQSIENGMRHNSMAKEEEIIGQKGRIREVRWELRQAREITYVDQERG